MIQFFEAIEHWLSDLRPFPRKVSVLTTCTAKKKPTKDIAELFYQGSQHHNAMSGIHYFRKRAGPCDVYVLSAHYGLVRGDQEVEPYNTSFSTMSKGQIQRTADRLGIPEAVRTYLQNDDDLRIVALGNAYFEACRFEWLDHTRARGHTVLLCSHEKANSVPDGLRRIYPVALGNAEAQRYGHGLISLKGALINKLLRQLAELAPRAAPPPP